MNSAAVALKAKQPPLVVQDTKYQAPDDREVVIRVHAVAINPVDWKIQDLDLFNLTYPAVLGLDIAGEIHEVGPKVHGMKKGDRVIALGVGYTANTTAYGAFQQYVVVPALCVAVIPENISLYRGVVLPLGVTTAAAGLYQEEALHLDFPPLDLSTRRTGRTILIWGGSSSVGSCAIQLAVASGYDVVATASAKNFTYVGGLGAVVCFDYHSPSIEDDVVEFFKNRTVVGAFFTVGNADAVVSCARILDRSQGKTLLITTGAAPQSGIPKSVRIKSISASSVWQNEVGPYIWRWLPVALRKDRVLSPKPDPLIVGQGLASIQAALDKQKAGVSAAKVVVTGIHE